MPKMLPKLPGLALAMIITMALLAAALAFTLAIAEGAGPAQEIKRRAPNLVAYRFFPPSGALPAPAVLPRAQVSYFALVPGNDDWKLQRWDNDAWRCLDDRDFNAVAHFDATGVGRGWQTNPGMANDQLYLRGVAADDDDDVCQPDVRLTTVSRILLFTYGTAPENPVDPPPGYSATPPDGIDSIDTLIYQAPGGGWTTQMLVSVAAAGVVMVILRSMAGLMIGILVLPVSAFGIVLIGYGSYWYVTVAVLFMALSIAAFTMITRRPGG